MITEVFCVKCGTKNPTTSKFCSQCGEKIHLPENEHNSTASTKETPRLDSHKCPNCGNEIKSFELKCVFCGHEIRETKANSSVSDLAEKLNQLETGRKKNSFSSVLNNLSLSGSLSAIDEQKVNLIKSYPIPNTQEDLLEFMVLSLSNIEPSSYNAWGKTNYERQSGSALSDAWIAKFEQSSQKALIMLPNDVRVRNLIATFEQKKKQIKRAKNFIIFVLIGAFGFSFLILAFIWGLVIILNIL